MDQSEILKRALRWYRGRTVLVTGASGYIGSALARRLAGAGCRLVCADLRKGPLPAGAVFRGLDVSAPGALPRLAARADAVFHFAAQTSAAEADADPEKDFKLNVRPLLELLERGRLTGRRPAIVFASTVTVFGPAPKLPAGEREPERPFGVYDAHKLAAEKYLASYCARGLARGAALRLANVYGPGLASGKKDRGVFNRAVRAALAGEPLTVYGTGDYLRDYVHIEDVVRAFLLVPPRLDALSGGAFVIGTGRGHTVREAFTLLAEIAGRASGRAVKVARCAPPAPLSALDKRNFTADPAAFRRATGWRPEYGLRRGIEEAVRAALAEGAL